MEAAAVAPAPSGEAAKKVRTWSQLRLDILEIIFLKLPFLDYVYAGAVCVSWRRAAVAARNLRSSPPRAPWLMFSQDPETKLHSFLSLGHNSKIFNLHLPIPHSQEEQYLGSFQEWLLLKKTCSRPELFLLNIISKARIQLPRNAEQHYVFTSNRYPMSCRALVDSASEGILSSAPTSDDCIVVMLLPQSQSGSLLALCRIGMSNPKWIVFQPYQGGNVFDIASITFYDGRLHAITKNYWHIVWELDVVPPAFTMFSTRPSLQIAARDWNRVRRDGIHLVESNSQLLLVLKLTSHCLDNNCVDDYLKTLGFYVFKMDPSSPTTRWVKVESLGDEMFFLGDKGSNSFSARGLCGFRGNCIYFTKNYIDYLPSKCDAAVFSLKDSTIQTLISKHLSLPLMWFMV
ncbi:hypothetical protein ACLOJK_024555 [Asimina triloba]